ncbi:MAG: tRNA 2-selenouridine(34) synthase MnmH [Paracoccus sp. (in: a-proteobacteria)]|uniref:tRNA 2-selenouridine(34) synthase MnmH n=1 Tax=Paracoccus sp. TaxID=267 RepID=UPI0026E0F289|nr:tRNA 2-selenouridine(34) synthase MnmH [Paracoccus sp. (in: a-proteobacteria)]MDO5620458.1 tRNA 2-selenouridine(34) synthase MnmH [Paracoccus sp. (in: a-proteobacteria)]
MRLTLTAAADPAIAGFDTVIDVRSPAEYADDHLPGAINLPVLDDAERARVGTVYKQVSPFDARKLGAALVAANAARHISGPLADKPGGWRPLVYCWRGGMRSGSFGVILAQIGWRVQVIEGGYKSWRRLVNQRVEQLGIEAPLIVLDGNTGSAKTAILRRLAARGAQVLDLEGLANHRGSLFGAMPGGQPSQRLFEGRLATAIEALDPARPVLVEAESSKIGNLVLPRAIWRGLCAAPRIRLEVPVAARAGYSARDYADAVVEPGRVEAILDRLRPLHPAARIEGWHGMVTRGEWVALAESLMRDHYDPRYDKHRARYAPREVATVVLDSLDDLDLAASRVEAVLAGLRG